MTSRPEDPETLEEARALIRAEHKRLAVRTNVPCPSWCAHRGDHPYMPEDFDKPGVGLWREHYASLSLAGCGVEFIQAEHAVSADGPMLREPFACTLYAEVHQDAAMTPQLLRQLAGMFEEAAMHLTAILDAREVRQ